MKTPLVLAALGIVAGMTGMVATAAASTPGPLDPAAVQTVVVGGQPTTLLPLQVDQLYPGVGTHARFVVQRGPSWTGGAYAVAITDVEDLERGCNRPEHNAGDISCGTGDDEGELSDQLLVNASWSSDASSCESAPVPSGSLPMRQAEGVPFTASSSVSAGDACLVVSVSLPIEADNLVQSDLARFSLQIGLEDAVRGRRAGSLSGALLRAPANEGSPTPSPMPTTAAEAAAAAAAAAAITPADDGNRTSSQPPVAALSPQPRALPFTGGQPLLLLGWGALLLFAGHVLVRATRQRRAAA